MAIDLDAYRAQSLATWREMAPGWEDRREWLLDITGRVNGWLVEKVDPQPGQTLLDIAAGTGDLGFAVAERVGDGGRVISSMRVPETQFGLSERASAGSSGAHLMLLLAI
jgi:hypothetical protein